jgi:hypothetical protein
MTNNFKEDSKFLNKECVALFKMIVMDNARFESDYCLHLNLEHERLNKKKLRVNPYRPRVYRYQYWR